jgi:hypothetical protein
MLGAQRGIGKKRLCDALELGLRLGTGHECDYSCDEHSVARAADLAASLPLIDAGTATSEREHPTDHSITGLGKGRYGTLI